MKLFRNAGALQDISSLALQKRRFVGTLSALTKSSVTGGEAFSLFFGSRSGRFWSVLIAPDACATSEARPILTRQR